jgi:hypothetical protein
MNKNNIMKIENTVAPDNNLNSDPPTPIPPIIPRNE